MIIRFPNAFLSWEQFSLPTVSFSLFRCPCDGSAPSTLPYPNSSPCQALLPTFLLPAKSFAPVEEVPAFHAVSIYPFATEMELSRLTIYFMIFLMAAFGPRTHEQVHSVLRMLAIFGFVLALFAVTQKATWNGKLYWVRELSSTEATL